MSLKNRRFSLDSSLNLDGTGVFGLRRSSLAKFSNRKSRQSHSLDEARLGIKEFHQSLTSNTSVRRRQGAIAEENHESSYEVNSTSFQKHNKSFHKLFPEIPEGENLTHVFTCALQKEVLYHGKLYVSKNRLCFHSSVLLKDTKVVISVSSVTEVKKHNSALSMLSVHTADGDKYSFVSLRSRKMCYKLLQSVCLYAQQGESPGVSPQHSSADNEAGHDGMSSYSSLEDSFDQDQGGHVDLEESLPKSSSDDTLKFGSSHQSSQGGSWIWSLREKLTSFFHLGEMRHFSALFFIYIILILFLLLASGYIGLKISALEEQLSSLEALTEMT
ncbi:GRAM domain-containing protein 2B-like [Cynoglossus semilaevis]|uniref:GRAM domain-containing protein 2B-like n=1 Tax=Cynoglossus semilaevis TaxID=244447 RepID=UPI0004967D25|nr:GRAM domain-containing protein 2B-like [Cynoglossus semilaevis]